MIVRLEPIRILPGSRGQQNQSLKQGLAAAPVMNFFLSLFCLLPSIFFVLLLLRLHLSLSACTSRAMYVFGGFNSLLLSDVLVYTSPSCSAFSSAESCRQAPPTIQCLWNNTLDRCLPWEGSGSSSATTGVEDQQQQLSAACNTRSCRWRRRRMTSDFYCLPLIGWLSKFLDLTQVFHCSHHNEHNE